MKIPAAIPHTFNLFQLRRNPSFVLRATCFLVLVPLTACRNHDFPDYPANYREFAYVTNGGSDTVSIYNLVDVRQDREIKVGTNPTGITANPKRNEVYVVNSGKAGSSSNGSVSVIDTTSNSIAATIPVERQPYFLDVDPQGDLAYVANAGSNSVSVLDLKARREVAVAGAGEGPGLARISPDSKTLVVTNRAGNSVSIFSVNRNPVSLSLRRVVEGCPGATEAVILGDSSKAFVACSGSHEVMAIALAHSDAKSASSQAAATPDALEAMLEVGKAPVDLALKPDGGELFVSNFNSDSISEIVTNTNDVGGAYIMGSHPVRGLVTGDNSLLFVSNFSSQEISVYSIDDGRRVGSISVGDGPDALAFSEGENLLLAVDARSGDLAVIRTSTRSLFTLLPTGREPNAIAVKAFQQP